MNFRVLLRPALMSRNPVAPDQDEPAWHRSEAGTHACPPPSSVRRTKVQTPRRIWSNRPLERPDVADRGDPLSGMAGSAFTAFQAHVAENAGLDNDASDRISALSQIAAFRVSRNEGSRAVARPLVNALELKNAPVDGPAVEASAGLPRLHGRGARFAPTTVGAIAAPVAVAPSLQFLAPDAGRIAAAAVDASAASRTLLPPDPYAQPQLTRPSKSCDPCRYSGTSIASA